MQPVYFASVLKLTENYTVLNYNSLYRVRLAIVVNKSGFSVQKLDLRTDSTTWNVGEETTQIFLKPADR